MSLYKRLQQFALDVEWSANHSDGCGGRCPYCDQPQNPGIHSKTCMVDAIVKDVKLVQQAEKIEAEDVEQ